MTTVAKLLPPEVASRLYPIRLLCLDVDGVMSDGHLYWSESGGWSQRFSVRDGYGIEVLLGAGIEVAVLSNGSIRSGQARAESLGIRHAYFGLSDKVETFTSLTRSLGLSAAQAAYIGDEIRDIPLLKIVQFAATVPDAVEEVRAVAHYVTLRPGGNGAVREVCDLIRLYAQVEAPH